MGRFPLASLLLLCGLCLHDIALAVHVEPAEEDVATTTNKFEAAAVDPADLPGGSGAGSAAGSGAGSAAGSGAGSAAEPLVKDENQEAATNGSIENDDAIYDQLNSDLHNQSGNATNGAPCEGDAEQREQQIDLAYQQGLAAGQQLAAQPEEDFLPDLAAEVDDGSERIEDTLAKMHDKQAELAEIDEKLAKIQEEVETLEAQKAHLAEMRPGGMEDQLIYEGGPLPLEDAEAEGLDGFGAEDDADAKGKGKGKGKVHGSLARAGKVRGQTPKVEPQEKRKQPVGRAAKRVQYNRTFVNVVAAGPGRKKGPNSNTP